MSEKEIPNGQVQPQDVNPILPMAPKAAPNTAESLIDEIIGMNQDSFIPWEEISLPSRGMYYGGKLPGGLCRVRAMGISDDKILATQRLAQTGQSIDYLFRHCVQLTDGMDPLDLLNGDRNFLLYYLRGITHGNNYEFMIKCPNCGMSSLTTYDLNELAKTIQPPKPELGDEPFKVILPYMSQAMNKEVWVKIRFMRGRDVSAIADRQRFQKKVRATNAKQRDVVIDQSLTENLSLVIVRFGAADMTGEVSDATKIRAMVDRMHAKDTATIREFLRTNAPGIDTQIEIQCPECAYDFKTDLPITESFFRPTSTGASG